MVDLEKFLVRLNAPAELIKQCILLGSVDREIAFLYKSCLRDNQDVACEWLERNIPDFLPANRVLFRTYGSSSELRQILKQVPCEDNHTLKELYNDQVLTDGPLLEFLTRFELTSKPLLGMLIRISAPPKVIRSFHKCLPSCPASFYYWALLVEDSELAEWIEDNLLFRSLGTIHKWRLLPALRKLYVPKWVWAESLRMVSAGDPTTLEDFYLEALHERHYTLITYLEANAGFKRSEAVDKLITTHTSNTVIDSCYHSKCNTIEEFAAWVDGDDRIISELKRLNLIPSKPGSTPTSVDDLIPRTLGRYHHLVSAEYTSEGLILKYKEKNP